jgi:hypothetical protein
MKWLLRLYPTAWRARYEAEVARMLDDSSSGPRDVPDLLRGALDAHRHPGPLGLPVGRIRGWFSVDHLAGIMAVIAGAAWIAAYLALAISSTRYSTMADTGSVVLTGGAGPLVVVAVAGFLIRRLSDRRDRLIAASALALVAVGSATTIGSLIIDWAAPGSLPFPYGAEPFIAAGTALVLLGTILATVAMWGCAPVARRALVLLAFACAVDLVFLAVFRDVGFVIGVSSFAGAAMGMLVGLAWISVGWSALTSAAPAPDARPQERDLIATP